MADLPRAGTLGNDADPEWAEDTRGMAAGPRTGMDAREAEAPMGGHSVEDSLSNRGPAAGGQLSQASGAVACRTGVGQAAPHPVADPHFGLQTTASGAMFADQSSERGSEPRVYGDIRPPFPSGGGEEGGDIVIDLGQSHAHYGECPHNVYYNSHFHNCDMYSTRETALCHICYGLGSTLWGIYVWSPRTYGCRVASSRILGKFP